MKTLADFKRKMAIGSKWECIHEASGNSLGVREVAHKDTVKFGFRTSDGTNSYCDFPKATEIQFEGDKVKIIRSGRHLLTYTFIE